ncbi:MAG: CehA/McbA family metallohydrolase [Candidatus Bathyarchaeia archaeon]
MKVKIDLHVHTVNSRDGYTTPREIPCILRRKGLDGIAVTDHDVNFRVKVEGCLILPGIEVSTHEGHIVGLGVLDPVPKNRDPWETVDLIRSQGGLVVIPHPYDMLSHSVDPMKLGRCVDAIEVSNASAIQLRRKKIFEVAEFFNLAKIGGSDSHLPQTIGDAYTVIEVDSPSVEDVLKSIASRRTEVVSGRTSVLHMLLKVKKDLLRYGWNRQV